MSERVKCLVFSLPRSSVKQRQGRVCYSIASIQMLAKRKQGNNKGKQKDKHSERDGERERERERLRNVHRRVAEEQMKRLIHNRLKRLSSIGLTSLPVCGKREREKRASKRVERAREQFERTHKQSCVITGTSFSGALNLP